MYRLSQFLSLACSIASALSAPKENSQKPLAFHNDPPALSQLTFGIGFDLTASYGSAAISFSNGTTIAIGKIMASDGYNEVLARLSLDSSQHPSPPYENLGDSWDDMPRQYLRKARKAIGRPASSDVGVLADMISQLRTSVEARVGPVLSAGVTIPHLVAIYDEDLRDAFEYLGLQYTDFYDGFPGHHMLYETSAAYAGYGFGLCDDYQDSLACHNQESQLNDTVAMAILYTRTALTLSLSIVKSAYSLWEPSYRYLVDFELGYGMSNGDDDDGYWGEVRKRLGQIMTANPYYKRPEKVLLMGDCIGVERFQRQLLEVLGDQMEDPPEILRSDSDVVAAVGIAELAKREPFRRS